jgi:hypothetical protein
MHTVGGSIYRESIFFAFTGILFQRIHSRCFMTRGCLMTGLSTIPKFHFHLSLWNSCSINSTLRNNKLPLRTGSTKKIALLLQHLSWRVFLIYATVTMVRPPVHQNTIILTISQLFVSSFRWSVLPWWGSTSAEDSFIFPRALDEKLTAVAVKIPWYWRRIKIKINNSINNWSFSFLLSFIGTTSVR